MLNLNLNLGWPQRKFRPGNNFPARDQNKKTPPDLPDHSQYQGTCGLLSILGIPLQVRNCAKDRGKYHIHLWYPRACQCGISDKTKICKDVGLAYACLLLEGRSWISSNPLWHAMLDPGIQHIHGQFGVTETWSLWLFRQVSSDRALWLFGFTKMSSAEQGLSKGGIHKQSDVGLCNYASLC